MQQSYMRGETKYRTELLQPYCFRGTKHRADIYIHNRVYCIERGQAYKSVLYCTHVFGLVCAHASPREYKLLGPRSPHQPWQPLCPPSPVMQANPGCSVQLKRGDHCILHCSLHLRFMTPSDAMVPLGGRKHSEASQQRWGPSKKGAKSRMREDRRQPGEGGSAVQYSPIHPRAHPGMIASDVSGRASCADEPVGGKNKKTRNPGNNTYM